MPNTSPAQLGQLSAGIAHEINNPNSVIMCSGQILNDIWEDAAKVLLRHYAEYGDFLLGGRPFSESASKVNDTIKAVIRCSRRIDDIVVNLKDYAGNRKTAVNEYFNLNTAVMNALLITAGLTKKHTDRLMTDLCSDLPPVHGSVSAIEQVVVNLLTNAVYALPDRTHGIHVSTAWEPSSGKVVLKVKDEGLGMTEDVRNKIYEPFFTTRFDSGGTGLGLSIAHTIVSNHGGLLDLESEPGSGTVARLELPAAEVDSPSEERGEHQG